MSSYVKLFSIALFALFISGCAKTELISDIDPQVDMSELNTFHVVKFEKDNRGIEKLIAERLQKMGYKASYGPYKKEQDVQANIEYQDKWMWDITMYMLELNIDFRAPDTDYKFATGRSYRTSLVRKTPEEMVEEVLSEIFKIKNGATK